jgi:polyphosphate kinase
MAAEGLRVLEAKDVTPADMDWLRPVFTNQLFAVLTPLAIDPAHPFPFLPNLGFASALKLKRRSDGKPLYALLPMPSQVARFWELPSTTGRGRKIERRFISLETFLSRRLPPDPRFGHGDRGRG